MQQNRTPLYSVYSDLKKLPRWQLCIVRLVVKALKLRSKADGLGRYWMYLLMYDRAAE